MKSNDRCIDMWNKSKHIFAENPMSSGAVVQSLELTTLIHRVEAAQVCAELDFENIDNVLDIGAGAGRWSREFASKVRAVTAIEPSDLYEILLENVKGVPNINCINVSFQDYDDTLQYDLIIVSGIFLNIVEDGDVILFTEKVGRLLKQGGIFVMREPVARKDKTIVDWQCYPPDIKIDFDKCQYWERIRTAGYYIDLCKKNDMILFRSFPTHAPFFQFNPKQFGVLNRLIRYAASKFFKTRNINNVMLYNKIFRSPFKALQDLSGCRASRIFLFRKTASKKE